MDVQDHPLLCQTFCLVRQLFVLVCLLVRFSGKLLVVACFLENGYCMHLVRIIVMNIFMIDIHVNMRDSNNPVAK